MRALLMVLVVGLAGQAQAVTIRPQPVDRCVEASGAAIRAAYHPDQAKLRCTRFLATTSLIRRRAAVHT